MRARPRAQIHNSAEPTEVLFIDPSVSDLNTIIQNLRPEVEAIVLDASRPVARQMAEALHHHHGLDAAHVMAHGAPGQVKFAAGAWAAETLPGNEVDLAGRPGTWRNRRPASVEL